MRQLTLNLSQGSVSFPFSPEAAQRLRQEIDGLMQSLKAIANRPPSQRPKPQPPLNYCHRGDVFLEVFCNPNIYASPFAAKVLIDLRDDKIRLNAEAELPRLVEDLSHYLEQPE